MQNFSREQIEAAEASLTPEQLALYDSPAAGQRLQLIAEKNGLNTEAAYGLFAVFVGDVVLGLIPHNEIKQKLQERLPGLNDTTATQLDSAIKQYVSGGLTTNGFDISKEIEETESTIKSLDTVRTMAGDMQGHQTNEGTYRSSQDELLSRQNTANQNVGPRWDTETRQ